MRGRIIKKCVKAGVPLCYGCWVSRSPVRLLAAVVESDPRRYRQGRVRASTSRYPGMTWADFKTHEENQPKKDSPCPS
jgi:hypothetical protein